MCRQFVNIPKEVMFQMMEDKNLNLEKAKHLSELIEANALKNQDNRTKGVVGQKNGDDFKPLCEIIFAKLEDLFVARSSHT